MKDGGSEAQREADLRECTKKAEENVPDNSDWDENPAYWGQEVKWRREAAVEECMKARGYRKEKVPEELAK